MSKPVNRAFFTGSEPVKKPSEMGGVYLAAACCQRSPLHSPNKKLMLKSDFCPQVTGNPERMHLAVLANKIRFIYQCSCVFIYISHFKFEGI